MKAAGHRLRMRQAKWVRDDALRADQFRQARADGHSHLAHAAPPTPDGMARRRVSPQPLPRGKTLSGLRRPSGLKAARTRRISSRSASLYISGINSFFSMPTPCSPVSVPPISTQNRMISSAAALARRKLRGIALIEKDQRVEVAVARVENVSDRAVMLGDFFDFL